MIVAAQRSTRVVAGMGWIMLAVSAVALFAAQARGQRESPPGGSTVVPDCVAATVDGGEVYVSQVNQHVERVLGDRTVEEAARQRLQAEALELLVKRQIVLAALEVQGAACSAQQVQLAMSRFKDELGRQGKSVDEYCGSRGTCVAALERTMRWQLSWSSYLEQSLTDDNLRKYFESHRADFDGTRMRVAQILLARPDDAAGCQGVEERAGVIRDEIVAGTITFAAAAQKYSQSPSASDSGALAWISRHEPMPEFFARAAFQLHVGEISQPLVSPLGVHLIQCLEIEAGQKTWQDVREALTAAVKEHLFEWNVTHAPQPPEVKYTGAVPYYRWGTKDLVTPERHDDPAAGRIGK